jgi:hypothetical protein
MSPLKVTAHLLSPLASHEGPMLDSICEWIVSFKMSSIQKSSNGVRHKCEPRARGCEVSEPGKIPIPIMRNHRIWKWPIPLCSAPIFSKPAFDCVEHFGKMLSIENAGLLAPDAMRQVTTTGGTYKSYRLPLRMRGIEKVVWFCVGNPRNLRAVLKQVDFIGKKTSIGYGRVGKWTVEPMAENWSWYAPQGGKLVLMRPLPQEIVRSDAVGYRPWYGAPVPPYWQRSLFGEIAVPI